MVYRSRAETEQDFYVGARRDVLRRVAGAWKIAGRKVILDQNVLLAQNVSIFFEVSAPRQRKGWCSKICA